MTSVREAVRHVSELESAEELRAAGVELVMGQARFRESRTVEVGERRLEARRFVICTGADPALPPIQGLQEAPYLTYRTVFDLDQRPCRLPVLGGGATSVELAQAFRRLGSEVTVLERRDRLIPIADPEASALVAEHFRDEGIGLVLGAEVQQVQRGPGKVGLEDIGVRLGRRQLDPVGRENSVPCIRSP